MENERSSSFSSRMCDGFQEGEAMEVQEMVRARARALLVQKGKTLIKQNKTKQNRKSERKFVVTSLG
jgi:hypothetical protein